MIEMAPNLPLSQPKIREYTLLCDENKFGKGKTTQKSCE